MYVDALHLRKDEVVRVVERVNGERVIKEFEPDWHFYIDDPRGTHKTIYGKPVKKIAPSNATERAKMLKQFHGPKHESDINIVMRCLETEYLNCKEPKLHVAFFDIEVDFDPVNGYSEPADALTPITAIAVYMQWLDQMVCLAVPPKGVSMAEAEEIAKEVGDTIIFENEKELLKVFLDLIEDADILSGWNSEAYDVPYTVNRIIKKLGKNETRRMCLWNELPKLRKFERGSKEMPTYDFIGRVHLDYMQLYKKYNYEERHSYALNAIAEAELDQQKVDYAGTLDHLYNHDFKKFIEYNIQDTILLHRLDVKLQYIDLCSTIAHSNGVLLPTTMGTVAMVDQAVVIEAHRRGMVCPNKVRHNGEIRAAGGWVATPKKGVQKWVGSADLNSLYPSVIRALNMSPETIIGQLDLSGTERTIDEFEESAKRNTFAMWWNDRFHPLEMENFFTNNRDQKMKLKFENGDEYHITGADLRKIVFDNGNTWSISANGTIFRNDTEGVIPGLLARWYTERKFLKSFGAAYNTVKLDDKSAGITMPADLFTNVDIDDSVLKVDPYSSDVALQLKIFTKLIEDGNRDAVVDYMNKQNLEVDDNGKVHYRDQDQLPNLLAFWDKRQLVKKINLNSAYGALLNAGSRFFDQRIGQSTTLTGRNITKHMAAKTNEMLTGVYDHYGECAIYGDTDSTYYSAYPALKDDIDSGAITWNKDTAIEVYNTISNQVSDTFPDFLKDTFNIPFEKSVGIIVSSREIVAESALFIKKKRYAALVYDDEGQRKDINGSIGKVKAMGLDLRRSDTPRFVQKFLMEVLTDTLLYKGEDHVIGLIKAFKQEFDAMRPWEKGTPKAVNGLTKYMDRRDVALQAKLQGRKVQLTIPGHVQASLNWNLLREVNNDRHTGPIVDAQKIIVCKLKETADNVMTSVAYPIDESHLPDWFLNLPFDEDAMREAIVDQKIRNLLGVLNWDLNRANKEMAHMESLFDFG
jgi:DNA polymerase elongation subunit (family B)